jgi:hypothetical protein
MYTGGTLLHWWKADKRADRSYCKKGLLGHTKSYVWESTLMV